MNVSKANRGTVAGDECEQPTVEHHDNDVDDGKTASNTTVKAVPVRN